MRPTDTKGLRLLLALAALCTVISGTSRAVGVKEAGIAYSIYEAYGGPQFEQVDWIRFTFNVEVRGRKVSRGWLWNPSDKWVRSYMNGDTLTYLREYIDEVAKEVDAKFINDSHWLVFPMHLVWDEVTLTDDGRQTLPIAGGEASRLTVRYPDEGGYTPGDMYRLYYDENFNLIEWTYHRGGDEAIGRAATWELTEKVGPIRMSLYHAGAEGTNFRLWFTDVALKLKGSDRIYYPETE